MSINLEMINRNKFSKLEDNSRELIKEFRASVLASYPSYNGALLIFRVFIQNIASDLNSTHFQFFEEATFYIEDLIKENEYYYNLYLYLKDISNHLIKTNYFLYLEDQEIIENCWLFIKFFVEEIYKLQNELENEQEDKQENEINDE